MDKTQVELSDLKKMLGSLIQELAEQEENEPEQIDKEIEGSNHDIVVPGNCEEFFGGNDQYEPEEIEMKSQKDNYSYSQEEPNHLNFRQNDYNKTPQNNVQNYPDNFDRNTESNLDNNNPVSRALGF